MSGLESRFVIKIALTNWKEMYNQLLSANRGDKIHENRKGNI